MGKRKIEPKWVYTCDRCSAQVERDDSGMNTRPKGWGELHLNMPALDFQGGEVGDASQHRLLCQECVPKAATLVKRWLEEGKP